VVSSYSFTPFPSPNHPILLPGPSIPSQRVTLANAPNPSFHARLDRPGSSSEKEKKNENGNQPMSCILARLIPSPEQKKIKIPKSRTAGTEEISYANRKIRSKYV
jgi:hypothetical protein